MPQLDPTPWFEYLVLSWLVFLFVIPTKIIKYNFLNEPATMDSGKPWTNTQSWTWC